jgi:hypothetical protein
VFVLRFRCHHNFGTGNRPAHQIVALNGGARGTAADDAAALQDLMEFPKSQRVGIRVHDIPLAPTVEPDTVGVAQNLGDLFGIGDFRVVRVQHPHVGEPALLPSGQHLFLFVDPYAPVRVFVAAGRWDHHNLGLAATLVLGGVCAQAPEYGPAKGTLVIQGGGSADGTGIVETFINKAGGLGAKI